MGFEPLPRYATVGNHTYLRTSIILLLRLLRESILYFESKKCLDILCILHYGAHYLQSVIARDFSVLNMAVLCEF